MSIYFCAIARLVAPSLLARQLASVAPVRVTRQSRHAGSGQLRAPHRQTTWTHLSRQCMWRHRASLSRHRHWRDKCVLLRRCLAQLRMACICVAVAWVHSFVAPPWLARQMPFRNGTRYCCCFASPFFLFFSLLEPWCVHIFFSFF